MSESYSFRVTGDPGSEGVLIYPRKPTATLLRPYIRSFTPQELHKCCRLRSWNWDFLRPLHVSLRIDMDFSAKIDPLFNREDCMLLHPLMGLGSNYDRCLRGVMSGSKSDATFGIVKRAAMEGTKDRLVVLCETVDELQTAAESVGNKCIRHHDIEEAGKPAIEFLNALTRYLCFDVVTLGRRQTQYTIEHDSEPDECSLSFRNLSRDFQPPGAVYITANEGDEVFVETHGILTFFTPIFKPVEESKRKFYYTPANSDCHLDYSQEAGCLIALAQQYFQKQEERLQRQALSTTSSSRSSSPSDKPTKRKRRNSKSRLDKQQKPQKKSQPPISYQPYIISTRGDHIVSIVTATISKDYLNSIEEGFIEAEQGIDLCCSKLYDLRDVCQRTHFTELLMELLTVLVRRWSVCEVDPLPERTLTPKQAVKMQKTKNSGKKTKGKSKSGKKIKKRSSNPLLRPITNCLLECY